MNNFYASTMTSAAIKRAFYIFDVEVNDEDFLKICANNTYIQLSQSDEALLNLGINEKSKIRVTIEIEITL
jgi:hypothetical protein